jgi:periplasmic protein TonB
MLLRRLLPISIPRFHHWRGPFARLDPSSRVFALALTLSIAFHALVLSVHFTAPGARKPAMPNTLDVVFVNSKTRSKPLDPDALAQANLDGGGNTDLDRRAKTMLPLMRDIERGEDLKQASRRKQELEERQRQLLSRLDSRTPVAAPKPDPQPPAKTTGLDLTQSALAFAHLEAQVSRSIDEYNKRPRKAFVGARTAEYRFAQYVEDWRQKIERIGNLNYPEGARGRIYGSLRLAVSINADGSLAGVVLESSSGYPVLDRAARRIVEMGAPFARFPADIHRDTDVLVITRTWHFAPGDKLFSE